MIFYTYIVASVIIYLIGDYFGKLWIANNKISFFAFAFGFCAIASLLFLLALKKSDSLSLTMLNFSLVSLLGGVGVGYFFFSEKLNAPQLFGLGFAIVAIILVGFPFETLSK